MIYKAYIFKVGKILCSRRAKKKNEKPHLFSKIFRRLSNMIIMRILTKFYGIRGKTTHTIIEILYYFIKFNIYKKKAYIFIIA